MTQRVKEFIEDYIAEIELSRWEEVFDGWYQETDVDEFWEDDEQFNELLKILDVLNVDTQKLRDARAAIIEKYTEDIVNTIQHNNYNRIDSWSIYWSDVLMKLNSLLGFSQEDIFALIFNEMDMAGVTPDYNKQRFVIEGL
jgi:hypothetical protein